MITISNLRTFTAEVLAEIPEFNKQLIVIDDSQLSKFMSDISEDDNLIFVAVIPSHKMNGNNSDDAMPLDLMLFMVLNKFDRQDGQEAFLNSMELCQLATKKLIDKMIANKRDETKMCGIMKFLQVQSISVDPVWELLGCDGYEINFQLKSRL